MAPQLRAQDPFVKPPKPDTFTVQLFRNFTNQATIPKGAILQVDTVKGAPRGDGTCDFYAGTPIRKPGTLRAAAQVDSCSIIYWTVDAAKFIEATKQAKPDTPAKPAVIYTYPDGRSTTDSLRILQKPFEAKPTKAPAMTTPKKQTFKPDTTTMTLIHAPHGALPQVLPDSVVRWMKDTVNVRLEHRRPGMVIGEPRVTGDVALVKASRLEYTGVNEFHEYAIEYRFERRGGVWTLSNQFTMMHGHGPRPSPDSLDVKRKP
jgi:hypothetical protein